MDVDDDDDDMDCREDDEDYLGAVSACSDDEIDDEASSDVSVEEIGCSPQSQNSDSSDGVIRDEHGWTWNDEPQMYTYRALDGLLQTLKPGPTDTVDIEEPESALLLFLDAEMRKKIVDCTNDYCATHVS